MEERFKDSFKNECRAVFAFTFIICFVLFAVALLLHKHFDAWANYVFASAMVVYCVASFVNGIINFTKMQIAKLFVCTAIMLFAIICLISPMQTIAALPFVFCGIILLNCFLITVRRFVFQKKQTAMWRLCFTLNIILGLASVIYAATYEFSLTGLYVHNTLMLLSCVLSLICLKGETPNKIIAGNAIVFSNAVVLRPKEGELTGDETLSTKRKNKESLINNDDTNTYAIKDVEEI